MVVFIFRRAKLLVLSNELLLQMYIVAYVLEFSAPVTISRLFPYFFCVCVCEFLDRCMRVLCSKSKTDGEKCAFLNASSTRTPLVSTSSSSSLFSLSFYINFSNMLPTAFCTVSESDALFCTFARGCLFSSDPMSFFS